MARQLQRQSLIPSLWHAVLWMLVASLLVLVVAIWYSGGTEADHARDTARRMVINLATGEIQGKRPTSKRIQSATASGGIIPAAQALEAVNPALQEEAAAGTIPVIGADGTKAWRFYSRPYEHIGGLPMVAIVITGVGHSQAATEAAIKLPAEIGISFSPYARHCDKWMNSARLAGHETFLDLPLEPNDYPASDPGPYGLLLGQQTQNNHQNFQKVMASAAGYVGMVTPYNERYSANNDAMKLLLQSVGNHGLMLVVGREPHKTETREMLDTSSTPNLTVDTWLDEDPSEEAIKERLATLEQTAKKRGFAIGRAQALPVTIQQLQIWSDELATKGIVVVPVTFIAKPRFS